MSWATGVMVFVVIWWTVIFAVLPLGVRRADDSVPGADRGAPQRPDLMRKALITTAIATVLWLIWFVIWVLDVFALRNGA
jgi:predicted secreted protein